VAGANPAAAKEQRVSQQPDQPRQNVTFASNGATGHGYLVAPSGGTGPGVIVIQEWWGLTDHIADVADRLAARGFVALAPDLFGGKTTHDSGEAGRLMSEMPADRAARDLSGAVDYLLGSAAVTSSTIGVVGFCMGGGLALQLASQAGDKVGAVVPFYGVGPAVPDHYASLTAAVQGHYGINDDFYPVEQAHAQEQQIRDESKADVEFFYYPCGHAFHNDENLLGTFDPDAAALAWTRTLLFLKERLG
jgi:carboxymethylenebutenolidase